MQAGAETAASAKGDSLSSVQPDKEQGTGDASAAAPCPAPEPKAHNPEKQPTMVASTIKRVPAKKRRRDDGAAVVPMETAMATPAHQSQSQAAPVKQRQASTASGGVKMPERKPVDAPSAQKAEPVLVLQGVAQPRTAAVDDGGSSGSNKSSCFHDAAAALCPPKSEQVLLPPQKAALQGHGTSAGALTIPHKHTEHLEQTYGAQAQGVHATTGCAKGLSRGRMLLACCSMVAIQGRGVTAEVKGGTDTAMAVAGNRPHPAAFECIVLDDDDG